MVLYNVTVNIDQAIEREWLTWMKQEYLPELMATGLPSASTILRLLTEVENGGVTYTVQCFFNEMEDYVTYQKLHLNRLETKHHKRYQNQYVSFQTLLEEA